MSEKMLVIQALDERGLLVKKITDKIAKASFVDIHGQNYKKIIESSTFKKILLELGTD